MTLRRFFASFLLVLSVSAMLACGSSASKTPPPVVTDVYAAGFETDDTGIEIAKYWKNGQAVVLGAGTFNSTANSITVSGNDVYVAGIQGNGTNFVAKYWKNGVPVELTDGTKSAFVHSIAVSGTDVYVAGEVGKVAQYWKNGVPFVLTDGTNGAEAWSIVTSGPDVYVAGVETKTTQIDPTHFVTNPGSKYWKNGVAVELTDSLTAALAFSMFISGSDIYVAGYACKTMDPNCALATYWKNGVPVQLTDMTNSGGSSIVVSGANIHVAGNQSNSLAENLERRSAHSAHEPVDYISRESGCRFWKRRLCGWGRTE